MVKSIFSVSEIPGLFDDHHSGMQIGLGPGDSRIGSRTIERIAPLKESLQRANLEGSGDIGPMDQKVTSRQTNCRKDRRSSRNERCCEWDKSGPENGKLTGSADLTRGGIGLSTRSMGNAPCGNFWDVLKCHILQIFGEIADPSGYYNRERLTVLRKKGRGTDRYRFRDVLKTMRFGSNFIANGVR